MHGVAPSRGPVGTEMQDVDVIDRGDGQAVQRDCRPRDSGQEVFLTEDVLDEDEFARRFTIDHPVIARRGRLATERRPRNLSGEVGEVAPHSEAEARFGKVVAREYRVPARQALG